MSDTNEFSAAGRGGFTLLSLDKAMKASRDIPALAEKLEAVARLLAWVEEINWTGHGNTHEFLTGLRSRIDALRDGEENV